MGSTSQRARAALRCWDHPRERGSSGRSSKPGGGDGSVSFIDAWRLAPHTGSAYSLPTMEGHTPALASSSPPAALTYFDASA